MGLFDEVVLYCPRCGNEIIHQSKGAQYPYLNKYTLADAPPEVLIGLADNSYPCVCSHCNSAWIIHVDAKVTVRLDSVSGPSVAP